MADIPYSLYIMLLSSDAARSIAAAEVGNLQSPSRGFGCESDNKVSKIAALVDILRSNTRNTGQLNVMLWRIVESFRTSSIPPDTNAKVVDISVRANFLCALRCAE